MKLIEYRILMPLTVEENRIGQRFAFCEMERLNTGGGEGVEIKQDELFKVPFDPQHTQYGIRLDELPEFEDYETQKKNAQSSSKTSMDSIKSGTAQLFKSVPDGQNRSDYGLYTYKLYKIESKVPWFFRKLVPKDMLTLHERAWNIYPHLTKTVIYNEYLKSKSRLEIDTVVLDCSTGEPAQNAHNLNAQELKKREVVNVDLTDALSSTYYKESEDPTKINSERTDRLPLIKGEWVKNCLEKKQPLVCVYKLVRVDFKVTGVQRIAENYAKNTYKELFAAFHRSVVSWIDKWIDLKEEDVRKMETDMVHLLHKQINQGELSDVHIEMNEDLEDNEEAEVA